MSPLQPIPDPKEPTAKGFSKTDVQALGLVLMILMVVNLPLYQSVLQSPDRQFTKMAVSTRRKPLNIASAKRFFTNGFKPDVPSLTKKSGASNSNQAH